MAQDWVKVAEGNELPKDDDTLVRLRNNSDEYEFEQDGYIDEDGAIYAEGGECLSIDFEDEDFSWKDN